MSFKAIANVDRYNLTKSDIVVVIMGPTGAGKSNFIDCVANQRGQRAGSSLKSCTNEINAIRVLGHAQYEDRLVLIDTPGFDDTYKSDLEILEMISDWMAKTYKNSINISAILYLHRITDKRMAGTPHRNLRMFGKLTGMAAAEAVVMMTTMWDSVVQQEANEAREAELIKGFWDSIMRNGATTYRFLNTPTSAWEIIDMTISRRESHSTILMLQKEIVDLKYRLNETEAGKELHGELQTMLLEQQKTLTALAETASSSNNAELLKMINKQLKEVERDLGKTQEQVNSLRIPFIRRIRFFITTFLRRRRG